MTYDEAKKAANGKKVYRTALMQFETKVPKCIKYTRYDQYKYIYDTVLEDGYNFKTLKEEFFADNGKSFQDCGLKYITERNSTPQEIRHRHYRSEVIISDINIGNENEDTYIPSGFIAYFLKTGKRANIDIELDNYDIEKIAEEAIKKGLLESDIADLQDEYILSNLEADRLKNCMVKLLNNPEEDYEDYEI